MRGGAAGGLIRLGRPARPPITACINVFNDADWLQRCLLSLAGKVAAIVVVDGAYDGFPHDKPWSTDGTLDIARQQADVVVEPRTVWPSETVKRHHYLQYVPTGGWWLRIDADEELSGELPEQLEGVCYRIMLHRTDGIQPYPIHALFRKGAHSRYYGSHHAVWWGRTLLTKDESLPVLSGVHLIHHGMERTAERWQAKGEYYPVLQAREREFRIRFGL